MLSNGQTSFLTNELLDVCNILRICASQEPIYVVVIINSLSGLESRNNINTCVRPWDCSSVVCLIFDRVYVAVCSTFVENLMQIRCSFFFTTSILKIPRRPVMTTNKTNVTTLCVNLAPPPSSSHLAPSVTCCLYNRFRRRSLSP